MKVLSYLLWVVIHVAVQFLKPLLSCFGSAPGMCNSGALLDLCVLFIKLGDFLLQLCLLQYFLHSLEPIALAFTSSSGQKKKKNGISVQVLAPPMVMAPCVGAPSGQHFQRKGKESPRNSSPCGLLLQINTSS